MCTVSFIPLANRVLLASNRDEHHSRSKAIRPEMQQIGQDKTLLFPKDPDQGGTWIGVNNHGAAVVLLNGGFIKHIDSPLFTQSRGKIVLEVLGSEFPMEQLRSANLSSVAPFTLIYFTGNLLIESRWDGQQLHQFHLDPEKPHIWSSVTLYDISIRNERIGWFTEWLAQNPSPNLDMVLDFHRFGGNGDSTNDLVMNRNNAIYTVSITGIDWHPEGATMVYRDLLTQERYSNHIPFSNNAVMDNN